MARTAPRSEKPRMRAKGQTSTGRSSSVRKNKIEPVAGETPNTATKLPTMYLDVIGTLVLQEGTKFRLAPFAKEFIDAVSDRFELIFMTSLSEPTSLEISRLLETDISYGDYRKGLGKASGIDFKQMFLWIDDAPTSRDLMRLAEERCSNQLITVNGKDGVTRATLNKVEMLCEELQLV